MSPLELAMQEAINLSRMGGEHLRLISSTGELMGTAPPDELLSATFIVTIRGVPAEVYLVNGLSTWQVLDIPVDRRIWMAEGDKLQINLHLEPYPTF